MRLHLEVARIGCIIPPEPPASAPKTLLDTTATRAYKAIAVRLLSLSLTGVDQLDAEAMKSMRKAILMTDEEISQKTYKMGFQDSRS